MANWWDAAPLASSFDQAIVKEGYDPSFAKFANSIYAQESSSGKNTATSNAGAVGGMQITPGAFSEVADEGWDINNPEHNTRAGLRYLKKMYDLGGGDPYLAAVGYYGGPGAIKAMQKDGSVRRDPRNPNAPDTNQYASQVLDRAGINWWDAAPLADEVQVAPQVAQPPAPSAQPSVPQGGIPFSPNQVQPPGMQQQPERGFWQGVGDNILDAGRQVGLTARYGLEGLGQAAGIATEPIRQGINVGLRAVGLPEAASTADVASSLANTVGLPTPQNANERVVGDIARTMAGAGGIAGGAQLAARGATGATQAVLNAIGSAPTQQVLGAAGAGGAGSSVREAGGGDVAQTIAAVAGGLAAPTGASYAQGLARNLAGRARAFSPTQVETQVRSALSQAGVDYSKLPARVRTSLNEQAAQAMRLGELDPAAMARLADFSRVEGAVPTRGMLSQDPQQVTREMNLAKMQANAPTFGANNLAQVQSGNNAALVRALNNMGANATDDTIAAGQKAIDSLQRRLGGQQARINDLYSLARDSAGRSFPLDGRAFADRAMQALEDNLAGGSLPADVRNHLNRISAGEVPFTVDYAEQLKTLMGRLQRNTSDGSQRYALGLVRSALDDTPVLPLGGQTAAQGARAVNPGNLPALANDATLGEDAIGAFNQARSANRRMMRQIENTPALKSLYDGNISPDNFVNKYITSSAAKTSDVTRLGRMLRLDPAAHTAVKSSITQQLKDKALSGVPDDIGSAKFSPIQYSKALKSIGDRKLAAFFTPDEIQQLHAIDRAGRLMVNQPVGSAVNNSNTAAALASSALDALGGLGRGLKLFGIGDQVGAIQSGLAQRSAQRVAPALAAPGLNPEINRFLPASMGALLLSAPTSAQNNQ